MRMLRRVSVVVVVGVLTVFVLASPVTARPKPVARAAFGPSEAATGLEVMEKFGAIFVRHFPDSPLGVIFNNLGLGDATIERLDKVLEVLQEIQAKLDRLQNSVDEIRVAVEKARCENIQTSLLGTQAEIRHAWRKFTQAVLAARHADKTEQIALAKRLRDEIQAEFGGTTAARAATRIHLALAGTPGSPSMISVCGVAFQQSAGDFVSSKLHEQVVEMVDYWQALEGQAASLAIGLDVAGHRTAEADASSRDTQRAFEEASAKIKPTLRGKVLDTRTRLLWVQDLRPTTYNEANRVPEPGWRLPRYQELRELIKEWQSAGSNIETWFALKTPFKIPNVPNDEKRVISADLVQGQRSCAGGYSPFPTSCVKTIQLLDTPMESVGPREAHLYARCLATWIEAGDPQRYLYQS